MPITIGEQPKALSADIHEAASQVAFPTLGHYLEDGFVDSRITRRVPGERLVGRAVTVKITATDSTMLHHVAGHITAGDVVVVDTGGDLKHAPLGEVVATALSSRGAAGIVVDGLCTDIEQLRRIGLPVYARGTTLLTTKLHSIEDGVWNRPVVCGGVTVHPGDVVLGDENGLLITSQENLQEVLNLAISDDAEEGDIVKQVEAGHRLGELTGASEAIRKFTQS